MLKPAWPALNSQGILRRKAKPFSSDFCKSNSLIRLVCRAKSQTHRRNLLRVQAIEWPDKELLDSVQENFPDAGVADAEEARVYLTPEHANVDFELAF